MAENLKTMDSGAATRERGASRPANGQNGGRAPAGPTSWYVAHPVPGVKYALTGNGYVTLGPMN